MTAEVPRRLRPTAEQRAKTIATQTKGAQSATGAVSAARPVTQKRRSTVYNPAAGGSLVASATYRDPATGLAIGAIGDPSGLFRSQGLAGSFFAYDSGSPGIALLLPGWYQVAASAAVSAATPGDAFRVFCFFTTPQTVEGLDIASPGGTASPTCMSLPFYDDGSGTILQVSVENHTGTSGQVDHPEIHVVAFGS